MKRVRNVIWLLPTLLLIVVGCSKGVGTTFQLTSNDLPSGLHGSYAYLLNSQKEVVDSALISDNGTLEYEGAATSEAIYMLALGTPRNIVIPELVPQGKGELYNYEIEPTIMEPDITSAYAIQWAEEGAELNQAILNFRNEMKEKVAPLADQATRLGYDKLWAKDDAEKRDSLNQMIELLNAEMAREQREVIEKYLAAHPNDAVSIVLFNEVGYKDEKDFIQKYNAAGSVVQNEPKLKARYEQFKLVAETSAGQQYKDFTMDNGEGEQVKLSDYMREGEYLLVDFWASWCGPCRKGMPHLAALQKQYGDKGLRILSIGVSEENKAANDKAAEEVGITWDRFYDASGAGADLYGIVSIPAIILIAPDGEILVRSSRPNDVDDILAEKLGGVK